MGLKYNYTYGQTPLDENEKNGLKIKSITTQAELDEFEQLNIEKAVEWTIGLKINKNKILTEDFILTLHKKMFGEVWNWAGQFRNTEKNLGIEWPQIRIELKKLFDDTFFWIENKSFCSEEIAIRFKHRLVSIHCFPNGNGRHSRIMADVIIEHIFGEQAFSWHLSNMVKPDNIRKKYINALKKADCGNIEPLVAFARL